MSFEELIDRWLYDYGGKIRTQKGESRVPIFLHLFDLLHANGFVKADVLVHKKLIIEACYNEHAGITAQKKAIWKKIVEKEFGMAMAGCEYWGVKPVAPREHNVPTNDVQYPEPEPTETPQVQSTDTEETTTEEAPLLPSAPRREYTQEEWDAIPTPQPLYDLELRKLLGFDT